MPTEEETMHHNQEEARKRAAAENNNAELRKRFDKARGSERTVHKRIADLKHTESILKEQIAADKSGDGIKSPDLVTTLKNVQGELNLLREVNPDQYSKKRAPGQQEMNMIQARKKLGLKD